MGTIVDTSKNQEYLVEGANNMHWAKIMDGFEEYAAYVEEGIAKQDPTILGILVAVVIGVLTLLFLIFIRSSNNRRSVLLLGLCDSGKTLLFSRLVHKKFANTFTSIKENIGTYKPSAKKPVKIVDLPGHERVRDAFLDQHTGAARALIFVVDSSNLQKEVKDVADFLYNVLTDSKISGNLPPVLVACNKQDELRAKGSKVIQSSLEQEFNKVRVTKSAALMGTDNSSGASTWLGKRDRDFKFDDINMRVEFAECSAGAGEDSSAQLEAIESWLSQIA